MKAAVTLKRNHEFQRLYRKGKSAAAPTLALYCRKNRQPEKWRDKKEVDANVNRGDELEGLSDEQLQAIIDGKEEK